MCKSTFKKATAAFVLGVFTLAASLCTEVRAQETSVDPAATQILKRMTDYLGSLQEFSVHTQNTVEDLLESGQRIDSDVAAHVIVKRPNKLLSERSDDLAKQFFYYDGRTLTLYDQLKNTYATAPASETLGGMLDYARQSLGLVVPAADFIYPNAYELLTQDLTSATVVGKAVIDGVMCDHLTFRRPGVDFQIWIEAAAQPRPRKLVVTDTGTPALLSVTTLIDDFNAAPGVPDTRFAFVPPIGAKAIPFMLIE
ncbi:MAG: DUF2092 domain-containing protein [Deltaproteobacteria bacterium]|jgi:hypothetical protein|nr:DUF2092 domain-containing protein [Deltaproteobacteria bacterium]